MTKLLDQGIEAVRALPAERQDVAGEVLLAIAGQQQTGYSLSLEQIEDIKLALIEADRGEFANDAEMAALWRKCGL
jgi:hypothetical protein